jgi:hypothetical protein
VDQLMRKIGTGWVAHVTANPSDTTLAAHWRDLFADFQARGAPDLERYRAIALNYGLPMARWQPTSAVGVVSDPVPIIARNRYDALARPAR